MALITKRPATVQRRARKTLAFTGATGLGDLETGNPITLFTVTGAVHIDDFTAYCTETCVSAGGGGLSVGTASDGDGLIALIGATNIAAGDFWMGGAALPSGTCGSSSTQGSSTSVHSKVLAENIILTVATADVTDGTIVFDVWYTPITDNGALS